MSRDWRENERLGDDNHLSVGQPGVSRIIDRQYQLWVNGDSTVLVRLWNSGTVEVSTRETAAHIWGPPIVCHEEAA